MTSTKHSLMRIGIDLGGTKIEIQALDDQGESRYRERIATPAGNYRATIAAMADLVTRCEQFLGCQASVGVAMPGSLSPHTGHVRNANSVVLNDRDLRGDLEHALRRPVRFENDANCFAISEATDGAAAGAQSVFGVIIGTGCGGALVLNGQLVRGANGIAGEWGHNPLPAPAEAEQPGPHCWCGRQGCVETWLSGPGMLSDHRRRGGTADHVREIVDAADAGDAVSSGTLGLYADRLARGLGAVINLFDPQVIVLGGGLSAIEALYETVPARWQAYVFADRIHTRLLPPRHGDASGVRGAARLWGVDEIHDGLAT